MKLIDIKVESSGEWATLKNELFSY